MDKMELKLSFYIIKMILFYLQGRLNIAYDQNVYVVAPATACLRP